MDEAAVSDSNGGSNGGCLPIGDQLPYSSTDTACFLVLTTFGAVGPIAYSFSNYFAIRRPIEFGNQPPVISVISPAPGSTFVGVGVVPIEWSATDDESMRSFNIQGSYDGGRTWHFIARDRPGGARSFAWDRPESNGISDASVRVVGFDLRFQDSSDTTAAFAITAASACPPDLTGDGISTSSMSRPFGGRSTIRTLPRTCQAQSASSIFSTSPRTSHCSTSGAPDPEFNRYAQGTAL